MASSCTARLAEVSLTATLNLKQNLFFCYSLIMLLISYSFVPLFTVFQTFHASWVGRRLVSWIQEKNTSTTILTPTPSTRGDEVRNGNLMQSYCRNSEDSFLPFLLTYSVVLNPVLWMVIFKELFSGFHYVQRLQKSVRMCTQMTI